MCGKTAVAKAIPKSETAKLWMFLAKWNDASPPSIIFIPTIANIYRLICQAIRLIDFGIINLMIFLNPGWDMESSGLYLYSVLNVSIILIIAWKVAPISTPVPAE